MYTNLSDAVILATSIRDGVEQLTSIEMILCPPVIWLTDIADIIHSGLSLISLGAQNIYYQNEGEFTGEISASMVKDVAKYVIVGHSERKSIFGETNQIISRKVAAVLDAGLSPIVCVGEEKQSENSVSEIVNDLREVLFGINKDELSRIIVAYEPVWAVGAEEPATPEYCAKIITKLREVVSAETPILYGGSVNSSDAYEFIKRPEIDGVLVGRASLKASEFVKICRIVSEYKKIV